MAQDFWGVGEMEVREGALSRRAFKLDKGDFIFPDGTHVSLPGNALIEARAFDEAWVKDGKPLTVYLGVKNWTDEGENVTVLPTLEDIESVHTRFVAPDDAEEISDLHAGGPEGQVNFHCPHLHQRRPSGKPAHRRHTHPRIRNTGNRIL